MYFMYVQEFHGRLCLDCLHFNVYTVLILVSKTVDKIQRIDMKMTMFKTEWSRSANDAGVAETS